MTVWRVAEVEKIAVANASLPSGIWYKEEQGLLSLRKGRDLWLASFSKSYFTAAGKNKNKNKKKKQSKKI